MGNDGVVVTVSRANDSVQNAREKSPRIGDVLSLTVESLLYFGNLKLRIGYTSTSVLTISFVERSLKTFSF